VAVAVRAGDEVLGSIWAGRPRTAQRRAHRGAVRRREAGRAAPAPGPRRSRRTTPAACRPAQLRARGGPGAGGAGTARLAGQPLMVLGVRRLRTRTRRPRRRRRVHERQRLSDAFAMHLECASTRARRPRWSAASPTGWCRSRLGRGRRGARGRDRARLPGPGRGPDAPVVGVGPVATTWPAGLARACTDRALRVLRERPRRAPGRAARGHPGRGADARAARPGRRPRRQPDRVAGATDGVRPPAQQQPGARPSRPGWTRSAT
jgi:hypothetical protein